MSLHRLTLTAAVIITALGTSTLAQREAHAEVAAAAAAAAADGPARRGPPA